MPTNEGIVIHCDNKSNDKPKRTTTMRQQKTTKVLWSYEVIFNIILMHNLSSKLLCIMFWYVAKFEPICMSHYAFLQLQLTSAMV